MQYRPMTSKQEALLLSLARKIDGGNYRRIDQIEHLLPLSRSAIRKGLSSTDASMCIDALQAKQPKSETEAPEPMSGDISPADLLSMLDQRVRVVTEHPDWPDGYRATVQSIFLLDGKVHLEVTSDDRPNLRRVDATKIRAWRFE